MKDKKCKTKGCNEMICSKKSKSGLCTKCYMVDYRKRNKDDLRKWMRGYRSENPENVKKYNKKFYKNHKEKHWGRNGEIYDKHKERFKRNSKNFYKNHKEEKIESTRLYQNKRYREDEGFRIRKQLGSALSTVIRVYIKTGKIRNPLKRYGIDWEGIIKQLSPIPKNRSKYHVDHIIPLFKFDLTNIEQIQLAFAPENHRWMLAKENQGRDRKGV